MQRTKQQALMFLLGAVLVGGALGFSADRYLGHEKFASQFGPRARFYDELGLTQQQRSTLDSLEFVQGCAMKTVLAPHDSLLKAMKAHFRAQRDSVFTKEQKAKLDQMLARRQAEQAKEPRRQCSGN
jgi:Spy/CpxP family protein refolding chaperone